MWSRVLYATPADVYRGEVTKGAGRGNAIGTRGVVEITQAGKNRSAVAPGETLVTAKRARKGSEGQANSAWYVMPSERRRASMRLFRAQRNRGRSSAMRPRPMGGGQSSD